jgi:hypothetical protein
MIQDGYLCCSKVTSCTRGGFHKSWAQGVKRKAHPNLGEKAKSWHKAQIHDAKIREKRWTQSANFKYMA